MSHCIGELFTLQLVTDKRGEWIHCNIFLWVEDPELKPKPLSDVNVQSTLLWAMKSSGIYHSDPC